MDNSSATVLGFQFEPERDSLQEPFYQEDDVNETEQEKSNCRVSQAVEEWCKCEKCEPMLTEKECRCCHEAASHYLNGNIRGGSRNFASSKLEIFAINDSQLPVRCRGFWVSTFVKSYLEISFDLIWYVYFKLIYKYFVKLPKLISPKMLN